MHAALVHTQRPPAAADAAESGSGEQGGHSIGLPPRGFSCCFADLLRARRSRGAPAQVLLPTEPCSTPGCSQSPLCGCRVGCPSRPRPPARAEKPPLFSLEQRGQCLRAEPAPITIGNPICAASAWAGVIGAAPRCPPSPPLLCRAMWAQGTWDRHRVLTPYSWHCQRGWAPSRARAFWGAPWDLQASSSSVTSTPIPTKPRSWPKMPRSHPMSPSPH